MIKHNDDAEKTFLEAVAWLDKGDFVEGRKILLRIVDEHPKFPNPYGYLGWLYQTKFSDNEKAEFYFKKGIEVGREYLSTYYSYISFFIDNNRFGEARNLISEVEKKANFSVFDIYLNYGYIHEKEGEFRKAIEFYNKAKLKAMNNDSVNLINDAISRCKQKSGFSFEISFNGIMDKIKENWFIIWLVLIIYIFFIAKN